MPIRKVKGGYKWGKSGKTYKKKKDAKKQARAAYASGYKKKGKKKKTKKKTSLHSIMKAGRLQNVIRAALGSKRGKKKKR